MNEILIAKDALQGLKTTFKNNRKYIWVFLVSFCIGVALLLIFLPSQKPARADEIKIAPYTGVIIGKSSSFWGACTMPSNYDDCASYTCTGLFGLVAGQYGKCGRPYNVFDLSTTTQIITSAIFRFAENYLANPCTTQGDFNVFSFDPTDPTSPTGTSDFTKYGTTTFSDWQLQFATSTTPYSAYYNFTLNANGLAWLNAKKGGFASLGVRVREDIDVGNNYCAQYTTFTGGNQSYPQYFSQLIINAVPPTPSFEITSPVDGSTQTTNFDVVGNYDILEENYNRLMVVFEEWAASSTCPIYGTQAWTDERALGYFKNQSLPYFSDIFTTSTGELTISVGDLAKGNYNCTRCHFFKENDINVPLSAELCNGYGVNIPNTLPPTIPSFYTGQNWATFYTAHGDKWATSTELFTYLAGKTAPLLLWVGNFTADFKNLFNNASSSTMGQQLGSAIPQARGYLTIINYYFAGIPIGEVFIFYLLTALVLIVLKIVLMIWHFFRG